MKAKIIQYGKGSNFNQAVTHILDIEHIKSYFYKYEDALIVYYPEYEIGLNLQNADDERLPELVEKYKNSPWSNSDELIKAIKETALRGAYFFKNTLIKFMENISFETAELMKKSKAEHRKIQEEIERKKEEQWKLEVEEEKKREQEERERELQEKKAKTHGYADIKNMTMMQLGKFLAIMEKPSNTVEFGYCNRIEFCVRALKAGYTPKAQIYYKDEYSKFYTEYKTGSKQWTEYQMQSPKESSYYTLTKTEYDFSVWMQGNLNSKEE